MLIHGQNLFPLTQIEPRAVGYYMDRDGEIWSERARQGVLTKLKGSRTPAGRYITLQTNGSFGQTYSLAYLQLNARAHRHFTTDTAAINPLPVLRVDLAQALGLRGSSPVTRGAAPGVQLPGRDERPQPRVTSRGVQRPLVQPVCPAPTPVGDRHHAVNATEGIQKRGWVIALVSGDKLVFSLTPAIHTTLQSVNDEMKRLATLQPGKKFAKLRIEGALTVGTSIWE